MNTSNVKEQTSNDKQKNFTVYKSSAGSGKTFTLVKEYLRIALADPSNPPVAYKNILAITFTNKAAAEMKDRVIRTLQKLSSVQTDEAMMELLTAELNFSREEIAKRSKNLLSSILHNYSEFSIGTIDSFVHRIVRTFAVDLKLPVNFSIETKYEKILAMCVDELMRKVGEDPVITSVLMEFTKNKVQEDKSWRIDEELARFAKKILDETGMLQMAKIKNLGTEDYISIKNSLIKFVSLFEKTLQKKGEEAVNYIEQSGYTDKDFYQGNKGIWNYFRKISKGDFLNKNINSYVQATVEEHKWKSSKSSLTDGAIEKLSSLFSAIESYRKPQVEKYFTYKTLFKNIYSLMVVSEIEKLVEAYKEEENIVFISEFNRKISEVVLNEPIPFVYERIGEKYKHYLLDEFQDTSVLQWQNLLPLVDNSLANGNFNLVVGDGKQSIYRWRGGQVEQFTELPKIYGAKNDLLLEREQSLERNHEGRILESNFRSKKNIVAFNNLFYQWLKEEIVPERFQKVYDAHHQIYRPQNEGGFISFDRVDEETTESKDKTVCEKTLEYIHKNVNEFNYRYGDITVLVRKKDDGKKIADFLVANKIPIVSSESLQIGSNESVRTLVAVLHLVLETRSHTHEGIILNYLLRAGFFPNEQFAVLWESFSSSKKNLGDWLFERNGMDIRRFKLQGLPLYEMCATISRQLKIAENDSLFTRFFLDEVLSYTKQYRENLKAFLEWWEENLERSAVLPSGTDAVIIMTIHASKGLEFPVVIMPFSDWMIDQKDFLWIELQEQEFPGLKTAMVSSASLLQETPYGEAATDEKNKQLLDNVNMLYVATTRAINHLHIISRNRKRTNFVDDWLGKFFKEKMGMESSHAETGQMLMSDSNVKRINAIAGEKLNLRDWKELVRIKFSADGHPEMELKNEKRESGILFHLAMSKISETGQEISATNFLSKNGYCNEEQAKKIKNKISALFKHPEFEVFFKKENAALNEPEIAGTDEKMYRPDRVIFFDDHVAVIDYKTGAENEEYEVQLEKYATAIRALGHPVIKKYIIYVEDEKVEQLD